MDRICHVERRHKLEQFKADSAYIKGAALRIRNKTEQKKLKMMMVMEEWSCVWIDE